MIAIFVVVGVDVVVVGVVVVVAAAATITTYITHICIAIHSMEGGAIRNSRVGRVKRSISRSRSEFYQIIEPIADKRERERKKKA